jgi:hypothetical protein
MIRWQIYGTGIAQVLDGASVCVGSEGKSCISVTLKINPLQRLPTRISQHIIAELRHSQSRLVTFSVLGQSIDARWERLSRYRR